MAPPTSLVRKAAFNSSIASNAKDISRICGGASTHRPRPCASRDRWPVDISPQSFPPHGPVSTSQSSCPRAMNASGKSPLAGQGRQPFTACDRQVRHHNSWRLRVICGETDALVSIYACSVMSFPFGRGGRSPEYWRRLMDHRSIVMPVESREHIVVWREVKPAMTTVT